MTAYYKINPKFYVSVDCIIFGFVFFVEIDIFETFVKKVAGSVTVNGRNRERIAESEVIEFIEFCRWLTQ